MMNFGDFHFLRPLWFAAVCVLLVITFFWLRRTLSQGSWAQWCDARLLPFILEQKPEQNSRLPCFLFVLAALLAIFALAGPTWQRLPLPVYLNQSALIIALDLSRSMDAQDVQPSRLVRARYKISDILEQRKDGVTALVVYSNHAFTVTPLTDDRQTIANQLAALETSIMPAQGSRAAEALNRAAELLKQSGIASADILLITDGVDESALDSAQELKQNGYRLHVLGMGTEAGAPIPIAGGGFIKDREGNIILSKLEHRALDSLARSGGGSYRSLTLDDSDIRAFVRIFDRSQQTQQQGPDDKKADQWVEQGPWILLGILPVAALAFRRGYLAMLVYLMMLPFPQTVLAWQWKDLWQSRDQQGYQALQQGDAKRAAELFEDLQWKASAEYAAGQYAQALESLNQSESRTKAYTQAYTQSYNKGNALARSGQFREALESYKKGLELNPDDEDARFNRDLVEKMLKEQESSEKQSSGANNSSKDPKSSSAENSQQAQSKDSESSHADHQSPQPSDASENNKEPDESKDSENKDEMSTADSKQPAQAAQQEKDEQDPKSKDLQEQGSKKPADERDAQNEDAPSQTEQEIQQANEQWLRRIPDDPGGLLRRKFEYQYKRSRAHRTSDAQTW